MLNYIVCATPRTGSSLLCEGLWATGIAGYPGEVFAPEFRDPWLQAWRLERTVDFARYLDAVIQHGTTSNGVFGTKIQYMHVRPLADEAGFEGSADDVLEHLFPCVKFVNIVRRDRRAQALSWYRAMATNRWAQWARTPAPTNLRSPAIEEILFLEKEIERQQSGWENLFSDRGIDAGRVEYDELDNDYRGQVSSVLAYLGLDPYAAQSISPSRLVRQADSTSRAWRSAIDAHDR